MWIEIVSSSVRMESLNVTPFAGVWIEIRINFRLVNGHVSVTPFAGVWIEITNFCAIIGTTLVTPFAGVWIEIS